MGSAKTKKEENRIKFNEIIDIPVRSQKARLLVRMMDEDMTTDDVCGEGYVNLANCGCFSGNNNYKLALHVPAKPKK